MTHDAFAEGEANSTDCACGKADIRSHSQPLTACALFAQIDRYDLARHDRRHFGAERRKHLRKRTWTRRFVDQTKHALERGIATFMDPHRKRQLRLSLGHGGDSIEARGTFRTRAPMRLQSAL